MIRLGTALKCTEFPYHRCLIISDPQRHSGMVVLVRITTDDGTWPDRDCLLTPQDWDQLEHPSPVVILPANTAVQVPLWSKRSSAGYSRRLRRRRLRCCGKSSPQPAAPTACRQER